MRTEEYRRYDAVGLADLVASGEVTAHELLDAAMAAEAAVNPTLNAVTADLEAQARSAIDAGLPDGVLTGVPYLLKDLGVALAGVPTSGGSALFRDVPAPADSPFVAALKSAGLVIFGKTNTAEFGFTPTTEPTAFGPTRNPWDLTRTPGGSSGGAAAAVSAGIAPAAHGSDGGGSIRIPASCCGLFGFKPSRGLVSSAPAGPGLGWFACDHAVTRSVRDSAVLLDIVAGGIPGDVVSLPRPETSFAEAARRPPARLRIGFVRESLTFGDRDPDCVAAVEDAARLCAALGHVVEETTFDVDVLPSLLARHSIAVASVAAMFAAEGARRGRPVQPDEVESMVWSLYEQSKAAPIRLAAEANQILNSLSYATMAAQRGYDVLLTSTLGSPPIPLGELDTGGPHELYGPPALDEATPFLRRVYGFMPNTHPFNTTGQPAMSVPLWWNGDGLPIGAHFVARPGADALLFSLAGQLEAARPWFDRRPRFS